MSVKQRNTPVRRQRGRCAHRGLRRRQPRGSARRSGARLPRLACAVGRRRPAAGRAVPDHPLRQPRCRPVVGAQARFGVRHGPLRRRFRRGYRRAEPGPAGARAGPRLGLGGHVGVPDPARCQRPGRDVHVGVRTEPGHPGRLHLQRPAAALAPATLRAVGQSDFAVQLHGTVLDTAAGAAVPSVGAVDPGVAAQRGRQHSRRADPSLRRFGQGCGPVGEDLPRQLLSDAELSPARARLRRAGAADRQHQRQVRAALRLRRDRALGAAAVAPRHQGRSLFADVASAGDGGGGARVRRPGRGQTAEPRAAARAGRASTRSPSATPWCRSPAQAAGSAARPRSPSRARAPRW